MKPIKSDFNVAQAALCLANEWRDTLSYGGGVAFTAYEVAQGNYGVIVPALLFAMWREAGRGVSWLLFSEIRLAGDKSTPVNKQKNAHAALYVANSLAILSELSPPPLPINLWWEKKRRNELAMHGAGLRDIPELYFGKRGMWDWPRKDDSNGPTQTQKLKQGFADFGKSLVAWLPQPAPAPAFIPAFNRAREKVAPSA